jgi:hypothetical protein
MDRHDWLLLLVGAVVGEAAPAQRDGTRNINSCRAAPKHFVRRCR